jgi:hypothetical protein
MATDQPTSQPPGRNVNLVGILVTTIVLVAAAPLVIYAMTAFWPRSTGDTAPAIAVHTLFGHSYKMSRDGELFAIVGLAGTLGALVHALRSLYWYVGNRTFKWSWLVFYLAIPVIGAALATIFYVVLRGGLVSGQDASANVNPYGSAAAAALVGLFTAQAAEKLKQIFSSIFTSSQEGSDTVPPADEASVKELKPDHGRVGTEVVLRGVGLPSDPAVFFHNNVPATVHDGSSATEVTVTVPLGATTGPVTLTAGKVTLTSAINFTVDP